VVESYTVIFLRGHFLFTSSDCFAVDVSISRKRQQMALLGRKVTGKIDHKFGSPQALTVIVLHPTFAVTSTKPWQTIGHHLDKR